MSIVHDRRSLTRPTGLASPHGATPRALVIVPDPRLAAGLACRLEEAGFSAQVAMTASAAEHLVHTWPSEVVILDLDIEGFSAWHILEQPGGRSPATVLFRGSADGAERVHWLHAGAADFVPSPVAPEEVVARVVAVLRRQDRPLERRWSTVVGPICMDEDRPEIEVDGRTVVLSPMERRLLHHLICHPEVVFSRAELLREVWGYESGGADTVTVHIRRLREKIEPDSRNPVLIRTDRGHGYCFSLRSIS